MVEIYQNSTLLTISAKEREMQYFHISCKPQFIISTTSYPSSSSSSPKAHHPACSYLTTICSVQVLIPDFPRQTACIRRSRSRRTTRKYISNVRADKLKQPSCVVHLVECLQSWMVLEVSCLSGRE